MTKRLIARGYFNRKAIEKVVNSLPSENNYSKELFSLVALELMASDVR